MVKKVKRKKKANNCLTINVRKASKETTDLNISPSVLLELREFTEDIFIPKLIRLAEKYAKKENKKTIQERDYLRAKDFVNVVLSQVDDYE